MNGPRFIATLIALAATIATIFVTPASWRRFLPPAQPKREHLAGLHQYIALAEADRLKMLQSPSGAELRTTDASGSAPRDATGTTGTPAGSAPGSTPGFTPGGRADTQIAQFHLHERLLAHAVLFGLEREWLAKLKLEHEALERSNADTLGDLVDATADIAEIALAIEAAGGALELTAAVGDLVDGGGAVVDAANGIFELFNS